MTWIKDTVLVRLIDAYKVIETVTRADRPKAYGNAMPESVRTPQEIYEFELDDLLTNKGQSLTRLHAQRVALLEKAAERHVAADRISQALEAQWWPVEYIASDERRTCLVAYCTVRARDGDWSAWLQARNRRNPPENGWIRRKTYRWNEQSLQVIAEKLNNSATMLHRPETCSVTHAARKDEPHRLPARRPNYWRGENARPTKFTAE